MDSPGHVTCFFEVETNTEGWQKPLSKVLTSIDGVTYSINAQTGMAKVAGKIDPGTLMKLLAKSGKYKLLWVESGDHNNPNAQNPNSKMPNFNYGYPQYYYNDRPYNYYGDYPEYYNPYASMEPYHFNDHPYQPSWYSYPQAPLPEPYRPPVDVPFYEPSPKYFPQPPEPPEGFNVGDPQWCSIM